MHVGRYTFFLFIFIFFHISYTPVSYRKSFYFVFFFFSSTLFHLQPYSSSTFHSYETFNFLKTFRRNYILPLNYLLICIFISKISNVTLNSFKLLNCCNLTTLTFFFFFQNAPNHIFYLKNPKKKEEIFSGG
jgi:hypothetical protein